MHVTRQHYVIVLHLGPSTTETNALIEAALPQNDERHFQNKDTGFPDHSTSYFVQSSSSTPPQNPNHHWSHGVDDWRKPSEFRRGVGGDGDGSSFRNERFADDVHKENLPPFDSDSYLSEASVHSALRLHQILDGLPSTLGGEFLLTILWPAFSAGIAPDGHVELFGALKRARDWFDADLVLHVNDEGPAREAASLWVALLNARAFDSQEYRRDHIFDSHLIWTGVVGDDKRRYRLFTAPSEGELIKERRKTISPTSNTMGVSNEGQDVQTSVRLLASHSLKWKKTIPRHKIPFHLLISDPTFYLAPIDLADETADTTGFPFPVSSSPDACAIVSLDIAIDGKSAPTNKDNGAGRRPWDKMAASTSGSSSGEEPHPLTALEFVFNRPHLTSTLEDLRDVRTIDFVVFPPMEAEEKSDIKLYRIRKEMEVNCRLFAELTPPSETADASSAGMDELSRALDELPSLNSADEFTHCVKIGSESVTELDSFLAKKKKTGPSFSPRGLPSPIDAFYLKDDENDARNYGETAVSINESDRLDGSGLDASTSAAASGTGGLLNDVAALVRADVLNDPFCRKIRAEDILAKLATRLDEMAEEVRLKRRSRLSSFEGANIAAIPWPDVKEIQWHDVYYNRGTASEEKAQEIHVLKTRCQPMETDVTISRNAASKDGVQASTKSSSTSQSIDHFDLFAVGTRNSANNNNVITSKKKRLTTSPMKKRNSSVFASPTKNSSSSSLAKPKTPKKTPLKKDPAFSPAAKKLLDRAKGVLTSPRKSVSMVQRPQQHQRFDGKKHSSTVVSTGDRKSESRLLDDKPATGSSVAGSTAKSSTTSDVSEATASQSDRDKERESRSDRNKKKLKEICVIALKARGVGRKEPIFNDCFARLYTISKSFVKDLKSSQNLREQMTKIVESHVDLVVTFEKNRV